MSSGYTSSQYASLDQVDELPWTDPLKEAELRGYLRGIRYSIQAERHARFVGFWLGVVTVFACGFALAVMQWASRT